MARPAQQQQHAEHDEVDAEAKAEHLGKRLSVEGANCPRRTPPKTAVTRPARPYKTTIERRFTVGNAKGAETPRAGPGRRRRRRVPGTRRPRPRRPAPPGGRGGGHATAPCARLYGASLWGQKVAEQNDTMARPSALIAPLPSAPLFLAGGWRWTCGITARPSSFTHRQRVLLVEAEVHEPTRFRVTSVKILRSGPSRVHDESQVS